MIKNVEIEMYGHNWLIEIDWYSNDALDFDINAAFIPNDGNDIDMSDLVDDMPLLEEYISTIVATKLKQEALNNV
jgi:hypothetical protein